MQVQWVVANSAKSQLDNKWKGNFKAGIRDGVWNKYSSDGILEFSITYENGIEKKYFGTKVFPEFFPADFESLIEKNPYIF